MDDAYVTVGRLTKPHGIRGVMKLASFTASAEDIFMYASLFVGEAKTRTEICKKSQCSPDAFLVSVAGVADRTQAEAVAGSDVFARRGDLPKIDDDTFYFIDLIGCAVVDHNNTSEHLGTVVTVDDFGAQANLEVVSPSNVKFYVPFIKQAVIGVDITVKKISIDSAFLIAQKEPASQKAIAQTPGGEDK